MTNTAQNHQSSNPQVKTTFKLGLDTDLQQITVTIQADHQTPKPAHGFTVAQLAVDLWRWRTGRASLADLGLVVQA